MLNNKEITKILDEYTIQIRDVKRMISWNHSLKEEVIETYKKETAEKIKALLNK